MSGYRGAEKTFHNGKYLHRISDKTNIMLPGRRVSSHSRKNSVRGGRKRPMVRLLVLIIILPSLGCHCYRRLFIAGVSLSLVINYRRCYCYQQYVNCRCHGIDENPGQGLIICVNNTGLNLSLVTPTPTLIYHRYR